MPHQKRTKESKAREARLFCPQAQRPRPPSRLVRFGSISEPAVAQACISGAFPSDATLLPTGLGGVFSIQYLWHASRTSSGGDARGSDIAHTLSDGAFPIEAVPGTIARCFRLPCYNSSIQVRQDKTEQRERERHAHQMHGAFLRRATVLTFVCCRAAAWTGVAKQVLRTNNRRNFLLFCFLAPSQNATKTRLISVALLQTPSRRPRGCNRSWGFPLR